MANIKETCQIVGRSGVFLCALSLAMPVGFSPTLPPPPMPHTAPVILPPGIYAMPSPSPALMADNAIVEPGLWFLIWGGFFGWESHPSWFANPLGIMATILFFIRAYRSSLVLSFLALLVAQEAWRCFYIGIPTNEAGSGQIFLTWESAGFFLWLAGIASLFSAALLIVIDSQRKKTQRVSE
jgi:hypothetical protein